MTWEVDPRELEQLHLAGVASGELLARLRITERLVADLEARLPGLRRDILTVIHALEPPR
jgi:hypothetical protein